MSERIERLQPIGPTRAEPVAKNPDQKLADAKLQSLIVMPQALAVNMARPTSADRQVKSASETLTAEDRVPPKDSLLAQRIFMGQAVGRKRERRERLKRFLENALFADLEDDGLSVAQRNARDFDEFMSEGSRSTAIFATLTKQLLSEFGLVAVAEFSKNPTLTPAALTTSFARWLRKRTKPLLRLVDLILESKPAPDRNRGKKKLHLPQVLFDEVLQAQIILENQVRARATKRQDKGRFYGLAADSIAPAESPEFNQYFHLVSMCKSWPQFLTRFSNIRANALLLT